MDESADDRDATLMPCDPADFSLEIAALRIAGDIDTLAPELAPDGHPKLHDHNESIAVLQVGRPERSHWGMMTTLRGVEAIRGYCIAAVPLATVEVRLNGLVVHREPAADGRALPNERERHHLRKHVFNLWIDLSRQVPGRYALEVHVVEAGGGHRVWARDIAIKPPWDEAGATGSDGIVIPPAGSNPLADRIRAMPSVARQRRGTPTLGAVRAVLVQRVDQLGDMVVSIPAIERLRTLFPDARLVGLLTPANADLAESLGLFDELVVIDFPDDDRERRRVMPVSAQQALRDRLAPFAFDIAIDLAENGGSRPLLLLSGAPFVYGFGNREFPWLSAEVEGYTHDPANRHETASHGTKLVAMVEWLAAILHTHAGVRQRPGLDPGLLARFGIASGDRFAVLHGGARLAFTRWPHMDALARLILDRTNLTVVMMADGGNATPATPPPGDRCIRIEGQIPFAELDTLLSCCAVFVGNDSGPKHLAALRGAPVVALHMARNNWNEWGQEPGGSIVSRRVPCAGCMVRDHPDECGMGFACLADIAPGEVFDAVLAALRDR